MESLYGTIIGIISAIIGYLFREYRNRVTPFIKVYQILGGSTKTTDYVTLDESIYKELESTFYLKNLLPKSSLGDINDVVLKATTLKTYWPNLKKEIETLLAISKEAEVMEKISDLFISDELKYWITLLLVSDYIKITNSNSDLPERTKIFESNEKDGEVWFAFPGRTINFGVSLNNTAIKSKVQPFIDIIQKWDISSIKTFFEELLKILDKEYQAGINVIHELNELLEEESRWIFYVYLANLSSSPLIVKNHNFIEISDGNKNKFIEETYMSKITESNGKEYIQDTEYPLIIPPNSHRQFCLITTKVQREMSNGKELRVAFDKGNSKFRLLLSIEKNGLIRHQKINSKKNSFVNLLNSAN